MELFTCYRSVANMQNHAHTGSKPLDEFSETEQPHVTSVQIKTGASPKLQKPPHAPSTSQPSSLPTKGNYSPDSHESIFPSLTFRLNSSHVLPLGRPNFGDGWASSLPSECDKTTTVQVLIKFKKHRP